MRDEETSEEPEDFPANDPTSALERLDVGFEDFGVADDPSAPLSRGEIDELVDQAIAEDLARLNRTRSNE